LRPRRLLDLFCGEGGASEGFRLSGFYVYGVDLNDNWTDRRTRPRPLPLKRYPFPGIAGDALQALEILLAGKPLIFSGDPLYLRDFSAIHASPPCQLYSEITRVFDRRNMDFEHPDLVGPVRELLLQTGLPYVIENVPGAPLADDSVLLCGSMFDPPLDVRRHRLFETNWNLPHPTWGCRHKLWAPRYRSADYRGRKSGRLMNVVPVYGGTRFKGDLDLRRRVMGMPWASSYGVVQAIPPRYTEFIGNHLLEHVDTLERQDLSCG
jgi:DNA (cytosine-5)-methyltransferase 1